MCSMSQNPKIIFIIFAMQFKLIECPQTELNSAVR